ncbi:MAG TPA: thiol:disulfide interchange protein DsbA/DsbL [Steroidobacteraceae bacterium]|nr:thiol:disulfide interchange protein DsbA/DsbL [Steroidobacteraceae bacterium]
MSLRLRRTRCAARTGREGTLLAALLMLFLAPALHAQTWKEGENYFRIEPAQHTNVAPGKIEVTEAFSYACPFCAQFNPLVQQLKHSLPSNAELDYLPASFNPSEDWPMFQRAACTAQALGILDKTHEAIFDAVWKTGELAVADPQTHQLRNPLPTIEDAARVYNRLTGVPVAKFVDTAKSFTVETKMRVDDGLMRAYQVDSTPTLIVNGKFRITVQSAGGMKEMVEVARWLVTQEAHQGH